MGRIAISAGQTTSDQEAAQNAAMQDGQLYVPPAYIQIDASQASLQLNSATCKAAFAFTPEIDFALSSMSFYINAVGTTGNIQIDLCAEDGTTAVHTNGDLNGSATNAAPTMTSNVLPAPRVVGMVDKNAANAETAGFEAFKAMDGLVTADNGVRSNAAPSGADPIYWYLDLGEGNSAVYNKFRFVSFSNASADIRAFPKAFTLWGSNTAAPTLNTDADWTALLNAKGTTWTAEADPGTGGIRQYTVNNGTAYRHYRIKFTDRNGVNAYVALGEIRPIAATSKPIPGAVLSALGTKAVGAVPGWVRHTFAAYQLQRNKCYWVLFTGAAAKDFSLAVRRWNTALGSMFPDSVMAVDSYIAVKTTTDGTLWTGSLQNSKPAMLNVVLNSTANHCPQLWYGRAKGSSVYLPGVGVASIPAAGISLACDDLTATAATAPESATVYNVDVYDSSGTLTLVQYTTALTTSEGIEQGAANRRYLGSMSVVNIIGVKQGPIDVLDARWLCYPGMNKALAKLGPYSTSVTEAIPSLTVWDRWNANNDFVLSFVSLAGASVELSGHLEIIVSGTITEAAILIDTKEPIGNQTQVVRERVAGTQSLAISASLLLSSGFHVAYPSRVNKLAGTTCTYLFFSDTAAGETNMEATVQGWLRGGGPSA